MQEVQVCIVEVQATYVGVSRAATKELAFRAHETNWWQSADSQSVLARFTLTLSPSRSLASAVLGGDSMCGAKGRWLCWRFTFEGVCGCV